MLVNKQIKKDCTFILREHDLLFNETVKKLTKV